MTFKSRYEDFVDIIAGRVDPKRMLLRGRYRAARQPALALARAGDVPGLMPLPPSRSCESAATCSPRFPRSSRATTFSLCLPAPMRRDGTRTRRRLRLVVRTRRPSRRTDARRRRERVANADSQPRPP